MRNDPTKKTIKMLVTKDGSPDGLSVVTYKKDAVYTVPLELGSVFVKEGWAENSRGKEADKDPALNAGAPAGLLVLKEGMIARERLVKDELTDEELRSYALNSFQLEVPAKVKKHLGILQAVLDAQDAWEKAEQDKLVEASKNK